MNSISVDNDDGLRCSVETKDGLFDFPETIPAVVLKPMASLEKGQVVTIIGIDDDFYEIRETGSFLKTSLFEILDRTNVIPGSYALDTTSQKWVRISTIDENLRIAAEGEGLRPVTDFRFPVGNDSVLSEPVCRCINDEGLNGELINGNMYRAESVDSAQHLVFVTNEHGAVQSYLMSRFSLDF